MYLDNLGFHTVVGLHIHTLIYDLLFTSEMVRKVKPTIGKVFTNFKLLWPNILN